jgi:hypothetical protein
MSRVRATWMPLPIVAAAIALVAVVAGDLVLDIVLQARYEQVGLGEALRTTATDLSLAKEIFSAYFSPVDLIFWLLAASVAYRGVKASVLAERSRQAGDAGRAAAAPAPGPYGPTG